MLATSVFDSVIVRHMKGISIRPAGWVRSEDAGGRATGFFFFGITIVFQAKSIFVVFRSVHGCCGIMSCGQEAEEEEDEIEDEEEEDDGPADRF